jgi:hypothetical protein
MVSAIFGKKSDVERRWTLGKGRVAKTLTGFSLEFALCANSGRVSQKGALSKKRDEMRKRRQRECFVDAVLTE